MSEVRLSGLAEYKSIKEKRKLVNDMIKGASTSMSHIYNAVCAVINQQSKDDLSLLSFVTFSPTSAPSNTMLQFRNEIARSILRPEVVDDRLAMFRTKITSDIYSIYAISNFAFAEHIFRMECEMEGLRRFRAGGGVNDDPQTKMARILRRQAEDAFKAGRYNEAIELFIQADDKYPMDFTVHYQLGLIYFFEKADVENAILFFKKASGYAQKKSSKIYIHSLVFIGLITRLMAVMKNDVSMFSVAYDYISQAHRVETGYTFATYALVQCGLISKSRNGAKFDIDDLLKGLIREDCFFALQLVYDRALDDMLEYIRKFFEDYNKEISDKAYDAIKKIEDNVIIISDNVKYVSVPEKVGVIKAEEKNLAKMFTNKNFFDLIKVYNSAVKLQKTIDEINCEIASNRRYCEMREYVESILASYNAEYSELERPLKIMEEELKAAKKKLGDLNHNYPVFNSESEEGSSPQQNHDRGKIAMTWKETNIYFLIKAISGCAMSVVFVSLLFAYYLVFGIAFDWTVYAAALMLLMLIPLYGHVSGEIVYSMIENKRSLLKSQIKRSEKSVEIKKLQIDDADKLKRERFIKMIEENLKISNWDAKQVMEKGLEGNFEHLKNFIGIEAA